MAIVNKYRVWCDTDNKWVFVWAQTEPTLCPENPAHTIDSAKTAIVERSGNAQAFTEDGAAIITKKDRAELVGNQVIMKRSDGEMAPEASTAKDWAVPLGKTWIIRLFAASCIAYEVDARLEYWRAPQGTSLPPVTTGPDGVFERVNPFDNDADEPIAVLKLDGNSDSTVFYESLRFIGDGESFLRIILTNKDVLDSVESSGYFNGYEMDTE